MPELANEAFFRIVGHRRIVGRPLRETLPELAGQGFFDLLDSVLESGEPFVGHGMGVLFQRMPGAPQDSAYVDFVYQPIRDDAGKVTGVLIQGHDVTAAKKLEAALRRSEERYALASRATRDAVWDWDLESDEVRWALGVRTLFGYRKEDVGADGSWWSEHIHPDDRPATTASLRRVIDSTAGERWEGSYRFQRADGSYAEVADRGFVVRDPETGKARRMVGAMRDVTAERAAQAALRESEARLQAILDAAPSLIAVKDLDGRYLFVNRAAAAIFGRPRKEVLGRSDAELVLLERAEGWRANDRKVLQSGAPHTFEEPGPGEQVFLSVKFPLRNLEGAPYALCSISSDVSELRRVEFERERLAGVQEQMVRIVSHDVRSPLAALLMSAQALGRQPLPDNVRRAADRIQRSARRVEQVVRLMLDFTRSRLGVPIPVERRPVDLRNIARHVAEELQSADPQRRVVLAGEPACGEGDPDRLYQVLANLMENAFKYGDRSAPVTVTTSAEDGELVASVHNEGPPIPEELQARMFHPFTRGPQTEETVKVSMGLGLSIVDQLVKAHGGRVLLRSLPGEGTTFTIRLPRGEDTCA